ncbi:MAG: metallophosphoesterase family protein, partial [Candidatus Kapaibacteriota bacterium]
ADGITNRVPTVTPEEFKAIYAEFGYNEAISTDPNGSLSYIVEPVPGVWLYCLDACRWRENDGSHEAITGGRFSAETIDWLKAKLAEGRSMGKLMIAMMHHNLVEHFLGQSSLFPDYVVENWEELSSTFAEFGLNLIFTGHNHAHDARLLTTEKGMIIDVMTSSIVTWPCAIRRVNIRRSGIAEVRSEKIVKVNYDFGRLEFQAYAKKQLTNNLTSMIENLLKQIGVPKAKVSKLAHFIVDTYLGYLHGNESQFTTSDTEYTLETVKEIFENTPSITHLFPILEAMLKDLPPDDYEFTIDLRTGSITKAELK